MSDRVDRQAGHQSGADASVGVHDSAPIAQQPATQDSGLRTRDSGLPDALAGLITVIGGGWFLWQAFELREGPGYAAVGPRVFPTIVGLGLMLGGFALLLSARRAVRSAEPPVDWQTLGGFAALLAAFIALFQPLGFLIAAPLFLVAGARILGSQSLVRDVVSGVLLGLITYVVFTRLLGLELPAGQLEEPIRALQLGVIWIVNLA
jgi:putative tricarboxylic transport membrane protein